jgi:hypothetical protein
MRYSDTDMRGGLLNPLNPDRDVAPQAVRVAIAEFGLPRGPAA